MYYKKQVGEYHMPDTSIIKVGEAKEHKTRLQILEVMKKTLE